MAIGQHGLRVVTWLAEPTGKIVEADRTAPECRKIKALLRCLSAGDWAASAKIRAAKEVEALAGEVCSVELAPYALR
jgi:hypothetical protein